MFLLLIGDSKQNINWNINTNISINKEILENKVPNLRNQMCLSRAERIWRKKNLIQMTNASLLT